MTLRTSILRAALLLACAAAGAACTDESRSPVGIDVLPGGILRDGLQPFTSTAFERALDYAIFPSRRASGDRLPTAHDWPVAPGIESRPIFRFGVATSDSLVQNSELLDANLRLVYSLASAPSIPVEIDVHRVTSEWSEDAADWQRRLLGVPWSAPGGDFDPEPVATFTVEPLVGEPDSLIQADTLSIPLPAELVAGWRNETIENHGLILVQRTPGESVEFASRTTSGGGGNGNGPTLLVNERLPGEEGAIQLRTLLAREDTFLPHDDAPLAADPGLAVSSGDPTLRTFLEPTLEDVPSGATVASVRLVMTVAAARIPGDTLRVAALEAESEFLGEKTVFDPLAASTVLAAVAIPSDVAPGDTIVFEGARLTRLIRLWIRSPESNMGLGLIAVSESNGFGAIRFHGPTAAAALRPRLEFRILPPPEGSGG